MWITKKCIILVGAIKKFLGLVKLLFADQLLRNTDVATKNIYSKKYNWWTNNSADIFTAVNSFFLGGGSYKLASSKASNEI